MLVAALRLVIGVFTELPFLDPDGVDDPSAVLDPLATPALLFAAFSASRFCFEAEGAISMVVV